MRSAPVIAFSPIGGRPPDFVTGSFVTACRCWHRWRRPTKISSVLQFGQRYLRASARSFQCFALGEWRAACACAQRQSLPSHRLAADRLISSQAVLSQLVVVGTDGGDQPLALLSARLFQRSS